MNDTNEKIVEAARIYQSRTLEGFLPAFMTLVDEEHFQAAKTVLPQLKDFLFGGFQEIRSLLGPENSLQEVDKQEQS